MAALFPLALIMCAVMCVGGVVMMAVGLRRPRDPDRESPDATGSTGREAVAAERHPR